MGVRAKCYGVRVKSNELYYRESLLPYYGT